MKKKINARCPLQNECEQTCKYEHRERDCDYYQGNARPGAEIEDQESIKSTEWEKRQIEDMQNDEVQVSGEAEDTDTGKMVYIPIEKLCPHPDNPRKDLGDLTELADSIKKQGILQNLTVVPWFSSITYAPADDPKQQTEMGYRVVIGHRRLAAAKLAGMKEVPCVISDMKLREQVATMLLENMQRSDLTIYEQAQGFQMMINLGDSVNGISEQTGFSETTVRRRMKLLELDQEKFKAADARGSTLLDYMELDKIKSTERKNSVLEKIGTANFQYELKRAIDTEKQEVRTAGWIEALSAFATQVDTMNGYRNVKYYYSSNKPNVERPEDADSTEYYFNVGKCGYIYLLKKDEGQSQQEDPKAVRQREKLEWRRSHLAEAAERAYNLRKEFVQGVSASCVKKHIADITAFSMMGKIESYTDMNEDLMLDLLGVEVDEDDELTYDMVSEAVSKSPERALLLMIYCESGDGKTEGYSARWNAEYEENKSLDRLYDLLKKLGYGMSDEERALRDGTHELFKAQKEGGNDEK